jgi:hypothetical protein
MSSADGDAFLEDLKGKRPRRHGTNAVAFAPNLTNPEFSQTKMATDVRQL